MNASLNAKLESLLERYEELERLLSEADVIAVQDKFRAYSKEYAELEPVVQCFRETLAVRNDLEATQQLLRDGDAELRAMAEEESAACGERLEQLQEELQVLLLPRDPRDGCNVFLEIRAGTGGDEAALFSGDLFKMYSRY